MNITYREMTIDDYDEVLALWGGTGDLTVSDSDTPERATEFMERNPHCSFIALDGNRIVGTVMVGDEVRMAFIHHLFVDEAYRCYGIGAHLADMAEDALRQRNAIKSYLHVHDENVNAIRFWEKRGYIPHEKASLMSKHITDDPFAEYREMDEKTLLEYLVSRDVISESDAKEATVCEYGDGDMNHIFRVSVPGMDDFIVKQAMPHGKIDVTCFEPVQRMMYENEYASYYADALDGMIENRLFCDNEQALAAYSIIDGASKLRDVLMGPDARNYNLIGEQLGRYVGIEFVTSSTLKTPSHRKKAQERMFKNERQRQLTEMYILTAPFCDYNDNNVGDVNQADLKRIIDDKSIWSRAKLMLMDFLSNHQCVIHGDLHAANVLVTDDDDVTVIDYEFASWGPVAYDLGTLIGNIILSARTNQLTMRSPFGMRCASAMISSVIMGFRNVLEERAGLSDGILDDLLSDTIRDACWYAGCFIADRTYGYARFPEVTSIADDSMRRKASSLLIGDIEFLMRKRHTHESLAAYLELMAN